MAICPREAIDNKKTPLSNQISSKIFLKLSSEEAKNFLRSRRPIRSYKETSVPKEKIIGAVMVGYPKHNYPRLTDRNPLEVTFY